LKYGLEPWLFRLESAMNVQFFTAREQADGYYVRCNRDAFLRTDTLTKTTVARIRLASGQSTLDEERALNDRDPYPDDIGKEPMVPVNTVPLRALIQGISDDTNNLINKAQNETPDAAT